MRHNRPPPQPPASSFCLIVTLSPYWLHFSILPEILLCFQIFKEGDCQKLNTKWLFPQQFEVLIDNI